MEELVREFLGRLEAEEEKLLTWGVVDGGFSRDEVEELAQGFLDEKGSAESSASLIKELRDRRLLFDLNLGTRRVYRTRMAESVRLFARLRQLFPNRRWQVAPTLVADFRFGGAIRYKDFELVASAVHRTREFKGQFADENFLSITTQWHF